MCNPVLALVGGAALSAGTSLYQASKARKAQKKSTAAAEEMAVQERAQQQRQFNRVNQKQPNIAALLDRARQSAGGGVGSTMLTGARGISGGGSAGSTGSLLGSNSLLGR